MLVDKLHHTDLLPTNNYTQEAETVGKVVWPLTESRMNEEQEQAGGAGIPYPLSSFDS